MHLEYQRRGRSNEPERANRSRRQGQADRAVPSQRSSSQYAADIERRINPVHAAPINTGAHKCATSSGRAAMLSPDARNPTTGRMVGLIANLELGRLNNQKPEGRGGWLFLVT
jgi:hypothetical protein